MFLKLNPRQDRRRRKRQLINTSVRVLTKFGPLEALGINLSEGGMCLFTIAHLPLGSRVEVEFRPVDSKNYLRFSARVRHRALYLYGIQFEIDGDHSTRSGDEQEEQDATRTSHA